MNQILNTQKSSVQLGKQPASADRQASMAKAPAPCSCPPGRSEQVPDVSAATQEASQQKKSERYGAGKRFTGPCCICGAVTTDGTPLNKFPPSAFTRKARSGYSAMRTCNDCYASQGMSFCSGQGCVRYIPIMKFASTSNRLCGSCSQKHKLTRERQRKQKKALMELEAAHESTKRVKVDDGATDEHTTVPVSQPAAVPVANVSSAFGGQMHSAVQVPWTPQLYPQQVNMPFHSTSQSTGAVGTVPLHQGFLFPHGHPQALVQPQQTPYNYVVNMGPVGHVAPPAHRVEMVPHPWSHQQQHEQHRHSLPLGIPAAPFPPLNSQPMYGHMPVWRVGSHASQPQMAPYRPTTTTDSKLATEYPPMRPM